MTEHGNALGAGDRLASGPDDALAKAAFAAELEAAPYLHADMSRADIAHTLSLADAGVVDVATARHLISALRRLGRRPAADLVWDPRVGDIYNNRDVILRDVIGEIADHLATGRARRESTTVAWILTTRRGVHRLTTAAVHLVESLLALADTHVATLMPDFTYLQHAQPTTLAHYLHSFLAPLARDLNRLLAVAESLDASPAGSGSVNGSRFPLDRDLQAALLGFSTLRRHTRDAMWSPDLPIETMAAATSVMTTADRLAEELQIWSSHEFGYVELADVHCRTSVVMPQKKNPYALTHIRGEARRLTGDLVAVITSQHTPSAQPDNRTISYLTVPRALKSTALTVDLAAHVIAELSVDTDRLETAANQGYPYATDLCDMLTATRQIANRLAHRIVGRAVRTATGQGGRPITADDICRAAEELDILLELSEDEVAAERDGRRLVSLRKTPGGPGVDEIAALSRTHRRLIETTRTTLDAQWDTLDPAEFDARVDAALTALES